MVLIYFYCNRLNVKSRYYYFVFVTFCTFSRLPLLIFMFCLELVSEVIFIWCFLWFGMHNAERNVNENYDAYRGICYTRTQTHACANVFGTCFLMWYVLVCLHLKSSRIRYRTDMIKLLFTSCTRRVLKLCSVTLLLVMQNFKGFELKGEIIAA